MNCTIWKIVSAPAGAVQGRQFLGFMIKAGIVVESSEIDDVAQLLAQKRAESLSALLPAAFDGWPREEVEDFAAGASMFGGGLIAGAAYERDCMTVELQVIADSPAMTAMGAMFTNAA